MGLESIISDIEISLNLEKDAEIVYKSIKPEVLTAPSQRSKLNIKRDKKKILFKIIAEDSHAYRASLNSILRWVIISLDILKLMKRGDI
ncbi:Protein of unknown function DUF2144 [Methanothermus fervidus DSM 2088]|uniref:Transcription factor Pcc1 n=1 Tax=Methanothermus fervidus (strain ATCC 43054 / DSM 2088 / JCM 10308 / V24 S) TaxID=523846 RepID=E3GZ96_METFV|nr:KEOPS complex subunit Pcc1 [Methanothermus fervidus]ADP77628.1 Protein of unknown function DUF2144 [Methanothermus fervidus DSM 2088]